MSELLAGLGLFIVPAIIANTAQCKFNYTYTGNPVLFIGLFFTSVSSVVWLLDLEFPPIITVLLLVTAFLYILSISALVRFWLPMQCLYKSTSVPSSYEGLVRPKFSGQMVKVSEVGLQDLSAWLIVTGLIGLTESLGQTILVFTGLVFLLHIPGLWLFGKTYGGYFLVMSTALAFMVPIVHQLGIIGFAVLYMLHLSGYLLMYLLMGYLGRFTSPR